MKNVYYIVPGYTCVNGGSQPFQFHPCQLPITSSKPAPLAPLCYAIPQSWRPQGPVG